MSETIGISNDRILQIQHEKSIWKVSTTLVDNSTKNKIIIFIKIIDPFLSGQNYVLTLPKFDESRYEFFEYPLDLVDNG